MTSPTTDSHSHCGEVPTPALRVLCLGNKLLGDDAMGCVVADELQRLVSQDVDICCTPESGLHLLDCLLGVRRLVVVDTVQTGNAPPGTIYRFLASELPMVPGGSPHYVGMCETLALARNLGLPVADEAIILAVEILDCLTLGEEMSPAVRSAIPAVVEMIRNMMPAAVSEQAL